MCLALIGPLDMKMEMEKKENYHMLLSARCTDESRDKKFLKYDQIKKENTKT